MKQSKYIDIASTLQVLGVLYQNPYLLDQTDKYFWNKEDFVSPLHQVIFESIYNLHAAGLNTLTVQNIEDYLAPKPEKDAIFKNYKGAEWLAKLTTSTTLASFDFYYQRLKKMTLLREYEKLQFDLSWLYDPNELDTKLLQQQQDWLDNNSLQSIVDTINNKIDVIKAQFVDADDGASEQLGDNAIDILEKLKATPAVGYPLYGDYINAMTRGARFGKFFLRSAATGVGKSRTMIADACFIGCSQIYDVNEKHWVSIGAPQPTLFIATEQDKEEVTTMAISFISGVEEDRILTNDYYEGEWERVVKAAQILKNGKVFFECTPDFSIMTIENCIKRGMRDHDVAYVFFDYIHTSTAMLTEIGGKSGIKNMREDNILFLLSTALKDIAVKYRIFIMSSTQLNAAYQESDTPDQNLLRGSKAIADRIDWGAIMMDVSSEDLEKIQPVVSSGGFPTPNVKMSIYKCRQGKYKSVYLWMDAKKGICRFDTLFITDWRFNLLKVEDLRIKVPEETAF